MFQGNPYRDEEIPYQVVEIDFVVANTFVAAYDMPSAVDYNIDLKMVEDTIHYSKSVIDT
jgi:hypothetical protein